MAKIDCHAVMGLWGAYRVRARIFFFFKKDAAGANIPILDSFR